MKATVSEGQVTIPKAVRSKPGLRPGTVIKFGAHAKVHADRLLTRDRGFYRAHFSGLAILDP